MIKQFMFIECNSCAGRLELPGCFQDESLWGGVVRFATNHGWHAESGSGCHYCPSCKVPAKLAKAMEITK